VTVKKIEQKNLDNISMTINASIGASPKKIKKSTLHRLQEKYKRKAKLITHCTKCDKPLSPPFSGPLCGDCLKQWDIQRWARILARDHYGKATKCEKCGLVTKIGMEWHHWDYQKPLDVVSLCRKCHGQARWKTKEEFDNLPVPKRMNSL
jgi:hypothetical protein